MSPLPPSFSVDVRTEKRACVFDTHLALSRHGLLLARRLCGEFDLWLVRELWQILDNTQYYSAHPELLLPKRPRESRADHDVEEARTVIDALEQWEVSRMETDMAGLKIFWLSDALSESLLPKGIDPEVNSRFEVLAGSLDAKIERNERDDAVFNDCFRDAAALAAALIPYRGFILTRLGKKNEACPDGEPILCSHLAAWGMRCRPIASERDVQMERDYFRPILARSGISELLWAGLDLAVLHLVVPGAVVMPPGKNDIPGVEGEILSEAGEEKTRNWWKDAICFWYPL